MKKQYETTVRMYDEDIFVNTKTKQGYARVLKRIDPLLCKWSSKTYMPGHSFDDIKQELSLIIIEGIESFDPDKKVKLSTFLHTHLRNKLISKIKSVNKLSNDASSLMQSVVGDTCSCGGTFALIKQDTAEDEEKCSCDYCGKVIDLTNRKSRDELVFSSISKYDKNLSEEYFEFQNSISNSDNPFGNYQSDYEKVNLELAINKLKDVLDEKTFAILYKVCIEGYSIKDAAAEIGLTGWAASMRLKKLTKNKAVSEIVRQYML